MEKMFDVLNPATGEVIETLRYETEAEIKAKLKRGEEAFDSYRNINAHERARRLKKWSELVTRDREELAKLITSENGKPYKEALGEVDYANDYIIWYAEEAKRLYGRIIPSHTENKKLLVTKEPIGLVAAITPWNFPAAMMTRKVAPALAAACTIIVKPASETPLTTMRLIELAHEAGFDQDVVQYVNARGRVVGDIFTESPAVKKITFTGSTSVGKSLIKKSAETVKSVTMELGGHAPVIVYKDADIDFSVKQTIATKFRNAGQTCVCANRILVHEDILDVFTEKLAQATAKLRVGNGFDQVDVGPVINEASYEKIMSQISDARDKGAQVVTGGARLTEEISGYFIEPTILKDVDLEMDIMHEETFGPVAPVIGFKTKEEAVELANDTPFGLAAYFFTNDYKVGSYFSQALAYGIIGWNDGGPSAAHAPFGGMKESGLGREGGKEGIEAYLETKYISVGL